MDVWRSEGAVNVRRNMGKNDDFGLISGQNMMGTTTFKSLLCDCGCLEV